MEFFGKIITYGQSSSEIGLYISLIIAVVLFVITSHILKYFANYGDTRIYILSVTISCIIFTTSGLYPVVFWEKARQENYENIQNAITAEYSDAEFSEMEIREGTFTSEGEQYKYEVKDDTIIICQVSSGDEVKIIN